MASLDSLFGTHEPVTTIKGDLNSTSLTLNSSNHSADSMTLHVAPHVYEKPKPAEPRRANATFVLLARNSDLEGVIDSVRSMEDRFNRKYKYPWVILNEEPFTAEFIQYAAIPPCPSNACQAYLTRIPLLGGLQL